MNTSLVLLGFLIPILPAALAVVILVVVVHGQNKIRKELRMLRIDLDQRTHEPGSST